jgi:hypothetical protein
VGLLTIKKQDVERDSKFKEDFNKKVKFENVKPKIEMETKTKADLKTVMKPNTEMDLKTEVEPKIEFKSEIELEIKNKVKTKTEAKPKIEVKVKFGEDEKDDVDMQEGIENLTLEDANMEEGNDDVERNAAKKIKLERGCGY